MKLMTEMQDGCVRASDYCVDEECVDSSEAERLVHDAAAAHALVLALSEMCNDCAGVITERADELMAEWGFELEAGKP